MQKNPTTTHNGAMAIHKNDIDDKDRNKLARPRVGRVSTEENPTTGDHTQGEEKPKTKKTEKKKKSTRAGGRNRKRRGGWDPSLLIRQNREDKRPRGFFLKGDRRERGGKV
jgi:hypothetical protein